MKRQGWAAPCGLDYGVSDGYRLFPHERQENTGQRNLKELIIRIQTQDDFPMTSASKYQSSCVNVGMVCPALFVSTLKTTEATKHSWATRRLELPRHSLTVSLRMFRQRKAGADWHLQSAECFNSVDLPISFFF